MTIWWTCVQNNRVDIWVDIFSPAHPSERVSVFTDVACNSGNSETKSCSYFSFNVTAASEPRGYKDIRIQNIHVWIILQENTARIKKLSHSKCISSSGRFLCPHLKSRCEDATMSMIWNVSIHSYSIHRALFYSEMLEYTIYKVLCIMGESTLVLIISLMAESNSWELL